MSEVIDTIPQSKLRNPLFNAIWSLDSSGNPVGLVGPDGQDAGVVLAETDPVTGGITGLRAGSEYTPIPIKAPSVRVLKRFTDLVGVTIGTSNATVVSSIDPDSPFGCPALKLVCTFSATSGRVEVTPPALSLSNFNGHVCYSVFVDDTTKVGEFSTFIGTTGYAAYQQAKVVVFNGSDIVGGHRVIIGGPTRKTLVTDGGFVFGTSTLQATKLRITSPDPIGGTATVWVKDAFIPTPQRPIVCFTWDDGFDTWSTMVAPILAANGVKATFCVNSATIGSSITSGNVADLVAQGHELSGHNITNNKLRQLFGNGVGVLNGETGIGQTMPTYMADYLTSITALSAYGVGAAARDFSYHSWVQGGCDTASVEAAKALGISVARTASSYESQPYGFALGNNALCLRPVDLSNTRSLAQAKALVDDAKAYGGLCIFMGHQTAATATDSLTWAESDLRDLVAYTASLGVDILTMRELKDRLISIGSIEPTVGYSYPAPVRCIGQLIGANFNSTSDQVITIDAGQWKIEGVYVSAASVSLTTAAGGVYTATAKGGTAIVAASQGYSALTAGTSTLPATMAATPTVTGNIYLSLTTPQGAAATASVFVFGRPI